jgi:uncharacterized membrane protein YkvA (DUF1232 family)
MGRLGWTGRAVAPDPGRIGQLPNLVKLHWRLFRDPRVSWVPKVVMVVGIGCVVMPFSLIPVAGWLADALVFYLTIQAFIRLCPPNVVREHVMLLDQGG